MIEASRRNGVALMEAVKTTLTPNFMALREALPKAGTLRRYFSAFSQYSSRYDKFKEGIVLNAFRPELSNGALMDIGIYTIYPMDKIPPDVDLFLKDFKWEAKRRPAQRDVFDRTIRPSIRAAKSSQSRPQFPIAARIDAFKRRLIESRRWSDRNDVVQPDVIEWMYSLGWRPPEQEEENLPVVPLAGNAKEPSP